MVANSLQDVRLCHQIPPCRPATRRAGQSRTNPRLARRLCNVNQPARAASENESRPVVIIIVQTGSMYKMEHAITVSLFRSMDHQFGFECVAGHEFAATDKAIR